MGWKRTALTGTVAAMRCNELFRQILEIDPEVLTPSLSREAEPAILIRGYLRP